MRDPGLWNEWRYLACGRARHRAHYGMLLCILGRFALQHAVAFSSVGLWFDAGASASLASRDSWWRVLTSALRRACICPRPRARPCSSRSRLGSSRRRRRRRPRLRRQRPSMPRPTTPLPVTRRCRPWPRTGRSKWCPLRARRRRLCTPSLERTTLCPRCGSPPTTGCRSSKSAPRAAHHHLVALLLTTWSAAQAAKVLVVVAAAAVWAVAGISKTGS